MTVLRLAPAALGADRQISIDDVIDRRAVRTLFQPVVHLASATIAGFEALSRGPAGTALESPMALIGAARSIGRLGELDWLCRTNAMLAAEESGLPSTLSWLINVEPAGLAIECPPRLLPTLERARTELRVVLEIVERDMEGNVLDLIHATDQARLDSWGVALDDVGAEESSLALLPFLRPDVVKLDMSLVRRAPQESAAAITAAVRAYAERTGAVILAEGIETADHERLAKVFGATFGQGYYYGRPAALPTEVAVPQFPLPLRQHLTPLDGRTPFDALAETTPVQRARAEDLLHIRAHLEHQAERGSHSSVLLAGLRDAKYFDRATQARYDELAQANAFTVVVARDLDRRKEPTYHVAPLPAGSAMGDEWAIIVLDPHYAAALAVRELPTRGPDGSREWTFVYTHDREAVVDAARRFMQALTAAPRSAAARAAASATAVRGVRHDLRFDLATVAVPSSGLEAVVGEPYGTPHGFRRAAQAVLNYLNATMPMTFWSITRVENERQTYLYLDENGYGLSVGESHPWLASYCVHMASGAAPRVAPSAAAIPLYAAAAVNRSVQIGAYAGAPIIEPDGALFGAICGLDREPRHELTHFEPTLTMLSELLTICLANDRALGAAHRVSSAALDYASTDSLTGIHNRHGWDIRIAELDCDYDTYADPTVIVVIDLDNLKLVNDGAGGHRSGDQLLQAAAGVMRRNIRDHDFLARLGGDEFGIILTNTPGDLAPKLANRLTTALDRAGIPSSVGWAPLEPNGSVQRTIELADQAMYQVKRARKAALV